MSAKPELHSWVERLDDARAEELREVVRRHPREDTGAAPTGSSGSRATFPVDVSGHDFMRPPARSWQQIAAEQAIRPVDRVEDLFGDGGPNDESAEARIAAIREWRRDGGHG